MGTGTIIALILVLAVFLNFFVNSRSMQIRRLLFAQADYQRRFREQCPAVQPFFADLYPHFELLPVYVTRLLESLAATEKAIAGTKDAEQRIALEARRAKMLDYLTVIRAFFLTSHITEKGCYGVTIKNGGIAYGDTITADKLVEGYVALISAYFLQPLQGLGVSTDPPKVDCLALIAPYLNDADALSDNPEAYANALESVQQAQARLDQFRDQLFRRKADLEVEALEVSARRRLAPKATPETQGPT